MALRMSTGLRNKLLGTSSIRGIFTGGTLAIYTGSLPNSPDDAVSGALICAFSAATFGTGATAGTISIGTGVIAGTCAIAGTAGYFRFSESGDSGSASTSFSRMDGVVGKTDAAGADLTLVDTVLIAGQALSLTTGTLGFPES